MIGVVTVLTTSRTCWSNKHGLGGWSTEMCGDSTTNIEIAWNCTSKPPDTYGISPQEQLILLEFTKPEHSMRARSALTVIDSHPAAPKKIETCETRMFWMMFPGYPDVQLFYDWRLLQTYSSVTCPAVGITRPQSPASQRQRKSWDSALCGSSSLWKRHDTEDLGSSFIKLSYIRLTLFYNHMDYIYI